VASSSNGVLDCHSRGADPCPSPNSQTILNPEWQVNLLTEPVILIGHQHVAVFHLPCLRQIACFHLVLRVHHLGTHYAYDYIITRRAPRGSVRWFSRCGQPAICRSLSSTCMPPHISPWWALRDWVTSRRQPIPCQTGCNGVQHCHSSLLQEEQPQVVLTYEKTDHEWTKKVYSWAKHVFSIFRPISFRRLACTQRKLLPYCHTYTIPHPALSSDKHTESASDYVQCQRTGSET